MSYVLITGGSGGIGYELAKIFAANRYDLILVSSNMNKLTSAKNKIKKNYSTSILTIEIDLSKPTAAQELYENIHKNKISVDILVNNAGFGLLGDSDEIDLKKDRQLMNLNMVTPVILTKMFLKDMYRKKHGKILNIASTGAFQPGPYNSTYFASKSFILSYSRAVRYEARKKGVHICTLCPGTTSTDFFIKEGIKTPRYAMPAKDVARIGYQGLMKNKEIIIPGLVNKLMRLVPSFIKIPVIAQIKK